MHTRILPLAVLAAGLALAGCASQQPTQTGFLGDYSRLTTAPGHANNPAWRDPAALAAHNAFIVDEVVYRPAEGAPALKPEEVTRLTADFRDRLAAALSERYRHANAAGPGVMRVRAAITNVDDVVPLLNAVTMAAIWAPVTSGGATTETDVVDSISGARLAAYIGYNNGNRGFLGGPAGFLVPGEQARIAFTLQAKELRALLDAGPGNS